jgi:hypothetical protein
VAAGVSPAEHGENCRRTAASTVTCSVAERAPRLPGFRGPLLRILERGVLTLQRFNASTCAKRYGLGLGSGVGRALGVGVGRGVDVGVTVGVAVAVAVGVGVGVGVIVGVGVGPPDGKTRT